MKFKFKITSLFKFSLSTNIMIGLGAGIFTGLFFGESVGWMASIGNAFIRLLQMTILPYIVASLILGIGSLSFREARKLAFRGGILLLVFWSIALSTVLLMPLVFPHMESGAFFSTSSVQPAAPIDYMNMYIPSNPFHSMANTVIPAVVLFCMCVGVAVIGMQNKEPLLNVLQLVSEALTKVAHFVVRLTPIGVFAISAAAAGTMTVEEFGRLQIYFAVFIGSSLLLSFAIFPMLTSMLTPFRYWDVVKLSRDALITAFTTGNLFVILPVVTENSKELFKKYKCDSEESESLMDVIIPIYFNCPDSGKLMSLLFVLFAAWFIGSPMPVSRYPEFAFAGFFSFFGGVDMALPYLLDTFQIPSNLFQLYIIAGILNGRFGTLLAAMDLIAFTLICTGSLVGLTKFRLRRVLIFGAAMACAMILFIVGLRIVLTHTFHNDYTNNQILESMSVKDPVQSKVYKSLQSTGFIKEVLASTPTLQRIISRRVIRVGYNPDTLPFCYFNGKGELAGFDIAMANRLARQLDCTLEFYPLEYSNIDKQLNSGNIDIAMSGMMVSVKNLEKMDFTKPYMTLTMAFVVKSYRKQEFESKSTLHDTYGLKVATVRNNPVAPLLERYLPGVNIVLLDNNEDFFSKKVQADALLISAEAGSAWTLKYPSYTVAVPKPLFYKTNAAYAVAKNNPDLLVFLNHWLELSRLNGFVQGEYDYWILGKNTVEHKPRWSIMRNVLKWGIEPEAMVKPGEVAKAEKKNKTDKDMKSDKTPEPDKKAVKPADAKAPAKTAAPVKAVKPAAKK